MTIAPRWGRVNTYPFLPMTISGTDITRVRRRPHRASYDRAVIDPILDEALTCHVSYVRDGRPVVIPTIHSRSGDQLYLHGSPASGIVKAARTGTELSVGVTIVDALVLARSAMHHSMNYRSVVVHGKGRLVTDRDEMLKAFESVVEHVSPGRWPHLRPITDEEMRQTACVAMDLTTASAKIRTGGPIDDEEDIPLPIWAGLLPLRTVAGSPVTDKDVPEGVEVPEHVTDYER